MTAELADLDLSEAAYKSEVETLRAQVRELQKVARAAVAWVKSGSVRDVYALEEVIAALPPNALEEVSDG